MAPELYMDEAYDGKKVDIFAAGVCLYIMLTNSHPFFEGVNHDLRYQLIAGHRYDQFWDFYYSESGGHVLSLDA